MRSRTGSLTEKRPLRIKTNGLSTMGSLEMAGHAYRTLRTFWNLRRAEPEHQAGESQGKKAKRKTTINKDSWSNPWCLTRAYPIHVLRRPARLDDGLEFGISIDKANTPNTKLTAYNGHGDDSLLLQKKDPALPCRVVPFDLLVLKGRDTSRWAVWLGRHGSEKIAGPTKGQLKLVRTSL